MSSNWMTLNQRREITHFLRTWTTTPAPPSSYPFPHLAGPTTDPVGVGHSVEAGRERPVFGRSSGRDTDFQDTVRLDANSLLVAADAGIVLAVVPRTQAAARTARLAPPASSLFAVARALHCAIVSCIPGHSSRVECRPHAPGCRLPTGARIVYTCKFIG